MYIRTRRSVPWALLVFTVLGSADATSATLTQTKQQIVVRFAKDHVKRVRSGTDLEAFSYQSSDLGPQLGSVGVIGMEQAVPGFTHASMNTVSISGEPIVLPEDLADYYILTLAGAEVHSAIEALLRSGAVLDASPKSLRRMHFTPTDPLYGEQWGPSNVGQGGGAPGQDIGTDAAWNITHWPTQPEQSPIAILDTGIPPSHPDLTNATAEWVLVGGTLMRSYDDIGHGTAVSGIAGAVGNNREGISGVNPNAWVRAIKVSLLHSPNGLNIADGIDMARQLGVPVMNMSFGGPDLDIADRAACKNAFAAGVLLVGSMGNDRSQTTQYPAGFSSVFSVGAMTKDGRLWDDFESGCSFQEGSSWGSHIDVIAPGGRQIATTGFFGAEYYTNVFETPCSGFGGTSAAAPVVSGLGSLLKVKQPSLTTEDIAEVIRRTARPKLEYGDSFNIFTGWGLASAERAVKFVSGTRVVEQRRFEDLGTSGFPTRLEMNLGTACMSPGDYSADRYTLSGHVSFATNFVEAPAVWIRKRTTNAWDAQSNQWRVEMPNGWAEVVSGSITSEGFDVRTYVYEMRDIDDPEEVLVTCSPL